LEPFDDTCGLSWAIIIHNFLILHELKGGESLYFELLSQFFVLSGVYFGQTDGGSGFSKGLSSLGVFRSKGLAVSAPRSVKFDQKVLIFLNSSLKIVTI